MLLVVLHSLSHSVTQSLSHSVTQSLSYSVTHTLTHSQVVIITTHGIKETTSMRDLSQSHKIAIPKLHWDISPSLITLQHGLRDEFTIGVGAELLVPSHPSARGGTQSYSAFDIRRDHYGAQRHLRDFGGGAARAGIGSLLKNMVHGPASWIIPSPF